MILTNLKNFQIPDKYKGFKTYVNYKVKTFRVFKGEKIIEYHPDFIKNLNGYQKFFLLTWCIKYHKMRDYQRATNAALDAYKLAGCPEADLSDFVDRINENKKFMKLVKFNILAHFTKNKLKKTFINIFYSYVNFFKSIIKYFFKHGN